VKGRARQVVSTNIADAKALLEQLAGLESKIEAAAEMIAAALLSGHKLLACGNGGSAAEKFCTGQESNTSGAKRIPRGKTSVLPSVAAAKALIAAGVLRPD
jgi:hypothetical protein